MPLARHPILLLQIRLGFVLSQVMSHNYEADNVAPPVIALQGVVDPDLRHELEETINAFG